MSFRCAQSFGSDPPLSVGSNASDIRHWYAVVPSVTSTTRSRSSEMSAIAKCVRLIRSASCYQELTTRQAFCPYNRSRSPVEKLSRSTKLFVQGVRLEPSADLTG